MTDSVSSQVNLVSRDSLPQAAQRWLNRALPPDYTFPTTIVIEQEGSMDLRNGWTPFTASGVYKGNPLAFTWRARFPMATGIWFLAEDGHEDSRGWGGIRWWGIIPMGKRTDAEVFASQMVRNLGELPWLPGFALTDSTLIWNETDETTFEVIKKTEDEELLVHFEINQQGDVIRAYSPARVYDIPRGYAEAPWYYDFSDHQEFNGVRMPGSATATFEKSDGAWEYLKVKILSVTSGTDMD
jgi:hypothetical protein